MGERGIDWPRIDADVRRAETPPAWLYSDPRVHELTLERAFVPSWQWIGDDAGLADEGAQVPVRLLPGSCDEPLLLTRRGEELRCLSNVCTHRALELVGAARCAQVVHCRYHGRRFDLDGRLRSAPGFDDALDFPREADHLRRFPLERVAPWLFTSLDPERSFADTWAPVGRRLGHLPLERARLDPARTREWVVEAHWALYLENYLEGLHIPFLHPALNAALDFGSYDYELFHGGVLQLGEAAAGERCFEDLPAGHPDAGRRVAAWYFALFPNLLVNAYPWGISLNQLLPLGPARTRVRFLSYVWDPNALGGGASADLDRVEREDEAAVEAVQRGLRARAYDRGRYAPHHEQGTHHLHRWWLERLAR